MKVGAFAAANLSIAFALELAAFAALGYGAFNLGGSTAVGVLAAVGTLMAVTISWWAFVAPRAPHRHPLLAIPLKTLVFTGSVMALALNGHVALSLALGGTLAVNTLLLQGGSRAWRRGW